MNENERPPNDLQAIADMIRGLVGLAHKSDLPEVAALLDMALIEADRAAADRSGQEPQAVEIIRLSDWR